MSKATPGSRLVCVSCLVFLECLPAFRIALHAFSGFFESLLAVGCCRSAHFLWMPEGGHRPDLGLLGGLFETGTRTGEGACGGARVLPVGGLVGGLFLGLCVACVWPVFGLCLAPVLGSCWALVAC